MALQTASPLKLPLGTGMSEKGTGMSDKGTGMSDKGTGTSDKGTRMSDKGTRMSDKGTRMSEKGTGTSDKETGMSDKGTGMSDKGTGMSDKCLGKRKDAYCHDYDGSNGQSVLGSRPVLEIPPRGQQGEGSPYCTSHFAILTPWLHAGRYLHTYVLGLFQSRISSPGILQSGRL